MPEAEASPSYALLRGLPAVGKLVEHPRILAAAAGLDRKVVRWALRGAVAAERERRWRGEPGGDSEAVVDDAIARMEGLARPRLRSVVNATGVVINTNLGRSPLPDAALRQVAEVASGYCNLEVDLESGQRGSRHGLVEALVTHLTGAEAAIVVNNCAAAVLLLTDTFARGREVVVSRGQLIEIGGSFRLPEVLEASGARLREVGTTNKTYLADYERAIGPDTGLLMLSHTSNYRIVGFTAEPDRTELAALGRAAGVVTAEDLGSGLLVDLRRYGVPAEPTVQASLAAGLDLVVVSADKLLGGPQAGLVLGRAGHIARLRRNPLMRAIRPDKLALAALEGTLRAYLDPEALEREVPIYGLLARTTAEVARAAERLAGRLEEASGVEVTTREGASAVGGGTLPGVELPTVLVGVRPVQGSLDAFARAMRTGRLAVVGRVSEGWLWLDPRTLLAGDDARIEQAVRLAAGGCQ
ncbi:MAG: L-seryl-tRNA(Sec) selenium transferase [Candidatus Sericytochromatia bacterium]|nr:L-seryl-tRNA(Sec) selenium transferase [Candidatus Sericytochromatia bacterium]